MNKSVLSYNCIVLLSRGSALNMLPDFCYEADLASLDKESLWAHVETLAYTVDIGVNDPDSDRVTALIMSYQGQPVGAVWGAPITDSYDFHIAVHPLYQGKGIGTYLLDVMEREFRKAKIENPLLQMDAAVINPLLRDSLMSRGFYVKEEFMEARDEYLYMMTDASSLSPFYETAKARNLIKCKSAFHEASMKHHVNTEYLKSEFESWVKAPLGSQVKQEVEPAFHDIILHLPFIDNDRAFVLAQYRKQSRCVTPVHQKPVPNEHEQYALLNLKRRI